MGGFMGRLFHPFVRHSKDVRLLMVGLDATGKTTILYKLKLGEVIETVPTVGCNVEIVEYKNLRLTVSDLRGPTDRLRHLWGGRTCKEERTHGLIFVVDSVDRDRIIDAREQLQEMLEEEAMNDAVLLVYANKQDLPNALSATEVAAQLQLHACTQRPWHIEETCAISGEGIYEGLDWLSRTLLENRAAKDALKTWFYSKDVPAGMQSQWCTSTLPCAETPRALDGVTPLSEGLGSPSASPSTPIDHVRSRAHSPGCASRPLSAEGDDCHCPGEVVVSELGG